MRPLVASYLGIKLGDDEDEEPEPPLGGFGRFSLEYMNITGQWATQHHSFPDAGSFNDQDPEWTDAFFNWLAYWRYIEWELEPELEAQRRNQRGRSQDPLEQWFGNGGDVGDLL